MRIYISADMEGINGVVRPEQVQPGNREYEQAREWMVAEINAAIEGAVSAGAKEIVVNDAHNNMINIPLHKLDNHASLISGSAKPFSMMQGIDNSFDGVFFIGYHAKIGTPKAVMDHTYSYSIIRDVKINDVSVGEFGLNAGLAGFYNVRCGFVTGDNQLIQEAKKLTPEIESVAVKEGISRNAAHCYPINEALEEITQMAKRAIELLPQKNLFTFPFPLRMEIEFAKAEMAELVDQLSAFERVAPCKLVAEPFDYPMLYQLFLTALNIIT